jgi:hypothetical protein
MEGEPDDECRDGQDPGGDGDPEHEPGEGFHERQVSHLPEGQRGDAIHAEGKTILHGAGS